MQRAWAGLGRGSRLCATGGDLAGQGIRTEGADLSGTLSSQSRIELHIAHAHLLVCVRACVCVCVCVLKEMSEAGASCSAVCG